MLKCLVARIKKENKRSSIVGAKEKSECFEPSNVFYSPLGHDGFCCVEMSIFKKDPDVPFPFFSFSPVNWELGRSTRPKKEVTCPKSLQGRDF